MGTYLFITILYSNKSRAKMRAKKRGKMSAIDVPALKITYRLPNKLAHERNITTDRQGMDRKDNNM